MALTSRASRFFGSRSPDKTFADVAKELDITIRRNTERTTDVLLAAYTIACDGKRTVTLLDGSQCDTGDRLGLASKDRGWLFGALPRPMQSNNPGTGGVQRSTKTEGDAGAGRYFLDSASKTYEGRHGNYHAGRGSPPWLNGTPITGLVPNETWYTTQTATGDVLYDWDYPFNGDLFNYDEKVWDGDSWEDISPPEDSGVPYGNTNGSWIFTHAFNFPESYYSLDPEGNHYGESEPDMGFPVAGYEATSGGAMRRLWVGRCSTEGGGYRDVSGLMAEIAGLYTSNGGAWSNASDPNIPYCGSIETHLVFRDATTRDLRGSFHLEAVEAYCLENHLDRCTSLTYTMPWRAGIQVRPTPDGTWVVSVLNGTKAWVYEATASEDPLIEDRTATLLETVTFTAPYSGVLSVVYV